MWYQYNCNRPTVSSLKKATWDSWVQYPTSTLCWRGVSFVNSLKSQSLFLGRPYQSLKSCQWGGFSFTIWAICISSPPPAVDAAPQRIWYIQKSFCTLPVTPKSLKLLRKWDRTGPSKKINGFSCNYTHTCCFSSLRNEAAVLQACLHLASALSVPQDKIPKGLLHPTSFPDHWCPPWCSRVTEFVFVLEALMSLSSSKKTRTGTTCSKPYCLYWLLLYSLVLPFLHQADTSCCQ